MEYKTLTQNEKDEIIVGFLKGQETDHYLHTINMERYNKLANDESIIDKEFQNKCKVSAEEEYKAIQLVEKIIEHSLNQIPDKKRIVSAIKRLNNQKKNG